MGRATHRVHLVIRQLLMTCIVGNGELVCLVRHIDSDSIEVIWLIKRTVLRVQSVIWTNTMRIAEMCNVWVCVSNANKYTCVCVSISPRLVRHIYVRSCHPRQFCTLKFIDHAVSCCCRIYVYTWHRYKCLVVLSVMHNHTNTHAHTFSVRNV